MPLFRPSTSKMRKEHKRSELAHRIVQDPHTGVNERAILTSEWHETGLSPNLFLANVTLDPILEGESTLTKEEALIRDYHRAQKSVAGILTEFGFGSTVAIETILIRPSSLSFFTAGLKCIHSDFSSKSLVLGSSHGGCSSCRSRSVPSTGDPMPLCQAQKAVEYLTSAPATEIFKHRKWHLSPSLSFVDGTSGITALYRELTQSGGASIDADASRLGFPKPLIRIRYSTSQGGTIPEDIALTESVVLPDKYEYLPNFVSIEEEAELISLIRAEVKSDTLKRRVAHYGFAFDYHIQQVDPTKQLPMPAFLRNLSERLYAAGLVRELPDQVTINEYHPGQGIGFHIDVHGTFTTWVASLSLGSASVMEFRRQEVVGDGIPPTRSTLQDEGTLPAAGIPGFYEKTKTMDRKLCWLDRRCVAIFSDELRYAWQHSIAGRKSDTRYGEIIPRSIRYSITFRKVRDPRRSECPCDWTYYCDQKNPATYKHLLPTRLAGLPSEGAALIGGMLDSIPHSPQS